MDLETFIFLYITYELYINVDIMIILNNIILNIIYFRWMYLVTYKCNLRVMFTSVIYIKIQILYKLLTYFTHIIRHLHTVSIPALLSV